MPEREHQLPFDLRSLEIFLSVCETGAMAAAARALGVSQPAVSLAILELERKSGAPLFDRAVRPLALTAAGAILRQRSSALLADARQIPALLRETKGGKVPALRVGLVDSLSRVLSLPLGDYLASRADEVAILSGLTATHASDLLTRRLDLFLGVDDLEDLAGLERFELTREPYVLLQAYGAEPARTLAGLRALAAATPLVRFSARSRTGTEIDRHLRRLGIDIPRALEFDTPFGVAASVAQGRGFAITTPLCILEAHLPPASFVVTRLPGPQIARKLTLVARDRELGAIPKEIATMARDCLLRAAKAADLSPGS